MRSPGRPPVARREHRQRFWKAIALGLSSEDAAVVCGVSQAVGPGGSVNVAACHRSVWPRCRAATCRSPSARRSPSSRPRAAGFARSLGGSAGRRRRSRVSWAATPRPVAACWSTGPRPRRGTPIGVPGARRWPSSPAMTRCGSTCRTGLPARVTAPDGTTVPGPKVRWIGRRHGRRKDRRWARSWSPEQVAGRLRVDFPDDASMRISHEAIYQALYVQGRGALRRELSACLRTGRALRVPRARTRGRGKQFVTPEVLINPAAGRGRRPGRSRALGR
jgi:hypothetical protein